MPGDQRDRATPRSRRAGDRASRSSTPGSAAPRRSCPARAARAPALAARGRRPPGGWRRRTSSKERWIACRGRRRPPRSAPPRCPRWRSENASTRSGSRARMRSSAEGREAADPRALPRRLGAAGRAGHTDHPLARSDEEGDLGGLGAEADDAPGEIGRRSCRTSRRSSRSARRTSPVRASPAGTRGSARASSGAGRDASTSRAPVAPSASMSTTIEASALAGPRRRASGRRWRSRRRGRSRSPRPCTGGGSA